MDGVARGPKLLNVGIRITKLKRSGSLLVRRDV